jgi:hypothetical protein
MAVPRIGVEEKQVRDSAGDVALDVFIPMFAEEGVELGVACDFDKFLNAFGGLPPRTGEAVIVHLAVHGSAEADFDSRAIRGVSTTMNHLAEVISMAKFAATGATGLRPVKSKLNGVEQGGLAAAVHAAE